MKHRIFNNLLLAVLFVYRFRLRQANRENIDAFFNLGMDVPGFINYGILFVQWLPLAVIVMAFIANLLPVPLDIILSDFTCVMCIVAFLIETGQLMLGQTFLGTIGTEKPMLDAVVFVIALFSILCSRTVRDER